MACGSTTPTSRRPCAARRRTTSRCRKKSRRCLDHLDAEVAQLPRVRVVVALGKIAFDAWLQLLRRRGVTLTPRPQFGHGVVVESWRVARRCSIGCYHPSRQNTNTGKLTAEMMESVFKKARGLSEE